MSEVPLCVEMVTRRIIQKLKIGPSILVVLINKCSAQYKDIFEARCGRGGHHTAT